MAEPPLEAGAVNDTLACALPGVAETPVGAPGTVAGVTVFEAAEGTLLPIALVAITVHETGVPFTSPATTRGGAAPEAVCVPQVAEYDVIAEPPFEAGGANDTLACALPAVAITPLGAAGTVAGVIVFEAVDGALLPIAFVATTVHEMEVPLARPVTTSGDAAPDALCVPHVAVYDVIAEPPLDAGAVNDTVACALPAVAVTPVGAPGTDAGVTLTGGDDAGPPPTAFAAETVQATVVPLARPATTSGEPAPEALCVPQVAV
jgi:hypothetical protein